MAVRPLFQMAICAQRYANQAIRQSLPSALLKPSKILFWFSKWVSARNRVSTPLLSIRPDMILKMLHLFVSVRSLNLNLPSRHAMPNSLQLKTIKQQVIRQLERVRVYSVRLRKNKFRRPLLKTTRLHVQAGSIWCVRVKP